MRRDTAERGRQIVKSGKYAPARAEHNDHAVALDGLDADVPPDVDDHHAGEREEQQPTTWEPMDLRPYLRGEVAIPEPSVGMFRSDGLRLIYPGCEHVVVGGTESGKTWLAVGCATAELVKGNHVSYIHYEEGNAASTIERLLTLGVDADTLIERFHFAAPTRAARTGWLDGLLAPGPSLVVHDGVNEAMALHGNDIMSAEGASTFRRNIVMPCIHAGAATLSCDHVPKERDGRSRDAYGSVHKGNAITGARIVLEQVNPFGRKLRGASYVFITKDRPGHLRAHGRPSADQPSKTFIGTLVGDDSDPFSPFELAFFAPRTDDDSDAATDPDAELREAVYHIVAGSQDRTVASLRVLLAALRAAGHKYRDVVVRNAVDDLMVAGRLVEVPGKRNALAYQAVPTASQDQSEAPLPASAAASASPIGGEAGSGGTRSASEAVGSSGKHSTGPGDGTATGDKP